MTVAHRKKDYVSLVSLHGFKVLDEQGLGEADIKERVNNGVASSSLVNHVLDGLLLSRVECDHAQRCFRPFAMVSNNKIGDSFRFGDVFAADPTSVRYELLRKEPTQSGVAYPKYYAWVTMDTSAGPVEGAVRLAAVDRERFEVTDFCSSSDIRTNPGGVDAAGSRPGQGRRHLSGLPTLVSRTRSTKTSAPRC